MISVCCIAGCIGRSRGAEAEEGQCFTGADAPSNCSGSREAAPTQDEEEALLSDLSNRSSGLCCFSPRDVQHQRIGREKIGVLEVDNFFCPEGLPELANVSRGLASSMRSDAVSDFPGVNCDPLDRTRCAKKLRKAELAAKMVDFKGHRLSKAYVQCIDSALQVLDLRGQLFELRPLFVATGRALGIKRNKNQRAFTRRDVDWSNDWDISLRTLAYPGKGMFVHMDHGVFVANLHLTSHYNDSGTSFWRLKDSDSQAMEMCSTRPTCKTLVGAVNRHFDLTRKASEKWWSQEEDPTNVFEKYAVLPMRLNRLVMYPGHAPHMAHTPEEVVARLSKGEPRLMLQSFMRVQDLVLQFDPKVWRPD